MAETKPPSWPTWCCVPSTARVSSSCRQMPAISSASRTRPNRWRSAAGSQARKRGQARVHVVQPFSPWMQLSRPSSSSRWKGRYLPSSCSYPMTSWGQVTTQPAQPVQRPVVMTSA